MRSVAVIFEEKQRETYGRRVQIRGVPIDETMFGLCCERDDGPRFDMGWLARCTRRLLTGKESVPSDGLVCFTEETLIRPVWLSSTKRTRFHVENVD